METTLEQKKMKKIATNKTNAKNEEFNVEIEGVDIPKIVEEAVTVYVDEQLPKQASKQIAEHIKEATKEVKVFKEKAVKELEETFNTSEKHLKGHIEKELSTLKPVYITITGRDKKAVQIKGIIHAQFEECIFICEQERQLYMGGAAGSGKTKIAEQIAQSFALDFAHISCSAGLSEGHLLGRMLFNGKYVESDFVRLYENGGVFLFDEIDAADANTMLVINSALANNYLSVPNRQKKSMAKRHEDFICICAANTWGHGSFEYHGRNNLDAAFLDRFAVAKAHITYDKELEKALCSNNEPLLNAIWTARDYAIHHRMRKIISTRSIISGHRQMLAGKTLEKIIERFTLDYTREEKNKIFPHIQKANP